MSLKHFAKGTFATLALMTFSSVAQEGPPHAALPESAQPSMSSALITKPSSHNTLFDRYKKPLNGFADGLLITGYLGDAWSSTRASGTPGIHETSGLLANKTGGYDAKSVTTEGAIIATVLVADHFGMRFIDRHASSASGRHFAQAASIVGKALAGAFLIRTAENNWVLKNHADAMNHQPH